ncbi:hypothetical protein E4U33_007811 [Claviceps sp. LM78 group G4]|nr:hypothetical protein E4U33_007811 [Claviceps sp. LM78 group G4]
MPKKKDWGASTRSCARLASRELSEEPEREATATRTVKEQDDLCSGAAFPNDEHLALPPTEIADDSLIDESSLPPEQPEIDVDTQVAVDAQLMRLSAAQPERSEPPPRAAREMGPVTRETSAANTRETVGDTGSKSTDFAATKKLDPYGISQDAENPKFNPKPRESRSLLEVLEGKKEEFEGWMVAIIDYLHINRYTFRAEGHPHDLCLEFEPCQERSSRHDDVETHVGRRPVQQASRDAGSFIIKSDLRHSAWDHDCLSHPFLIDV